VKEQQMSREVFRQVRILNPVTDTDRIEDVLIEDGIVKAIEPHLRDIPSDATVLDQVGIVMGPGLVDLYSHSGEPGFEQRETLDSLCQAALQGGVTRLTLLPDTHPALDNPSVLEKVRRCLEQFAHPTPQVAYWGALTLDCQGEQMTELGELGEAGVIGFTDGRPVNNPLLLRRLLEYAYPLQKPVALWCCDRSLAGNGVVRECEESMRLGLPGSPAIAESAAIAVALECVAEAGTPVHLMRLSTARGVELVRQAKARGLPITASVTWMHLVLDIQSIQGYDPNLRVEPPLGTTEDRDALIAGLADGTLDAIAIDHTPYTYEEKTVAFAEAPPGMIGLELALPLLWQGLVKAGKLSALALWRSLSTTPAHLLQQMPPTIVPELPSEVVLFDSQRTWNVTSDQLKSLSSSTPWAGQTITGRVIRTLTN
jgi:dihydroorotase